MKTILSIETSCDETGIAIVQGSGRTKPVINVLADVIASQIAIHKEYGGVVPHLAAREHEKNLPIVLRKALKKSGISLADIDVIAVTKGPGLSPALWRGIKFAQELAQKWHKPLLGIDHMEGHLSANFISSLGGNEVSGISKSKFQISKLPTTHYSLLTKFPILCLTVSGGHTQLVLVSDWAQFELLGETVDDAAGEAFDKVARMLDLPYPGGPEISKLAKKGNTKAFPFPRPMLSKKNYLFSFSGLKTAVLYTLRDQNLLSSISKFPRTSASSPRQSAAAISATFADIAASFQQAVVDVLVKKTIRAAKEYEVKTIMLAGGVAANQELRNQLGKAIKENLPNTKYQIPNTSFCTDNGAMIGAAAYICLATQTRPPKPWRWQKLHAKTNLQKDVDIHPIEAEPARLITDKYSGLSK